MSMRFGCCRLAVLAVALAGAFGDLSSARAQSTADGEARANAWAEELFRDRPDAILDVPGKDRRITFQPLDPRGRRSGQASAGIGLRVDAERAPAGRQDRRVRGRGSQGTYRRGVCTGEHEQTVRGSLRGDAAGIGSLRERDRTQDGGRLLGRGRQHSEPAAGRRAFLAESGIYPRRASPGGVSWEDARAYAKWLSKKTDKTQRLLSEAEWE